ncbi:hypothetical protein MCERE3_00033 [Candidatus Nanopelagicaceae bacterium]
MSRLPGTIATFYFYGLTTVTDTPSFFFTYFNAKFLIQGTVAINSFLAQNPGAIGYIYSDEQLVVDALQSRFQNENISVINLLGIPRIAKEMDEMRQDRSSIELLISLKPFLFLETLNEIPVGAILTYIDADLFFYRSLKPMLSAMNSVDILLTQHIFPDSMSESVKYGQINAGLISVRKSKAAEEVLTDWAAKCRQWCLLRLEDNKYADQLYLDAYLDYSIVKSIADPGINNGMYYFKVPRRLSAISHKPIIDGSELVCFHFHGIRVTKNFVLTGFTRYNYPSNALKVWKLLYGKYISQIRHELLFFESSLGFEILENQVLHQLDVQNRIWLKRLRRTLVSSRKPFNFNIMKQSNAYQ